MTAEARKLRIHCRSCIVIPARLASTRLERKLLLRETGKTLIQHTYEAARRADLPSDVYVATDHTDIADEVESFGGVAALTSPAAASGTDRVAEVARTLPEMDVIVNLQGDEPEVSGVTIDSAIRLLQEHPEAVMSTLELWGPLLHGGRLHARDPGSAVV